MSDSPVAGPPAAGWRGAAPVGGSRVTAPRVSPPTTVTHTSVRWITARWPRPPDARTPGGIPDGRPARTRASHPAIGEARSLWIDDLTQAECRVLRYLPTHLTAREIADELYVSLNTVRTHIRHIYAKLGARCRSDAVDAARAAGLLTPCRPIRSRPDQPRRAARPARTPLALTEAA